MVTDLFEVYAELDPAAERLPDWDVTAPLILEAIRDEVESPPQGRTPLVATNNRRLIGGLVAASAFALVVAVFALNLVLAPGSDQEIRDLPAPSLQEKANQFGTFINSGDLESGLEMLSAESNCDAPAPDSFSVETCEQHWGHMVAMGADVRFEDCSETTGQCYMTWGSELFEIMGYPDHRLAAWIPMSIDEAGLLVVDMFSGIPETGSFMPDRSVVPLYDYLQENRPDLRVSSISGPDPKDYEGGLALMEAARFVNDPQRIITNLESALVEIPPILPRFCESGSALIPCRDLFQFLQNIEAEVGLECDVSTAADGTIRCPVSMTSAIHDALGSGPSSTEAIIEYQAGMVRKLTLDIQFAADPLLHEEFIEFARSNDLLYQGEEPVYTEDTAADWIAAAETFASR